MGLFGPSKFKQRDMEDRIEAKKYREEKAAFLKDLRERVVIAQSEGPGDLEFDTLQEAVWAVLAINEAFEWQQPYLEGLYDDGAFIRDENGEILCEYAHPEETRTWPRYGLTDKNKDGKYGAVHIGTWHWKPREPRQSLHEIMTPKTYHGEEARSRARNLRNGHDPDYSDKIDCRCDKAHKERMRWQGDYVCCKCGFDKVAYGFRM